MIVENVIVTGGCGFIGSALIEELLRSDRYFVVNVDALTYAAVDDSILNFERHPNYKFVHGDICDEEKISQVLSEYKPRLIFNLAAETHVDNSIENPKKFLATNIIGTYVMLSSFTNYVRLEKVDDHKFIHISTDEVYGSLGSAGSFSESSNYDPSSPYSASKASSDHLVSAWHKTYGLKTLVTNCSNNYGPRQNAEKLIPKTILSALNNAPIEIYGNGKNVRDWLYVYDHVSALIELGESEFMGERFNIGGNSELDNLSVVNLICNTLDEIVPIERGDGRLKSYSDLIVHVDDRLGHDFRYAIDAEKISSLTGWSPKYGFEAALKKTVQWYINTYGLNAE